MWLSTLALAAAAASPHSDALSVLSHDSWQSGRVSLVLEDGYRDLPSDVSLPSHAGSEDAEHDIVGEGSVARFDSDGSTTPGMTAADLQELPRADRAQIVDDFLREHAVQTAQRESGEPLAACGADKWYQWDSATHACLELDATGARAGFAEPQCCPVGSCDAEAGAQVQGPFEWTPFQASKPDEGECFASGGLLAPAACCKCEPDTPYQWDRGVGKRKRCRTDINNNGVGDRYRPHVCCVPLAGLELESRTSDGATVRTTRDSEPARKSKDRPVRSESHGKTEEVEVSPAGPALFFVVTSKMSDSMFCSNDREGCQAQYYTCGEPEFTSEKACEDKLKELKAQAAFVPEPLRPERRDATVRDHPPKQPPRRAPCMTQQFTRIKPGVEPERGMCMSSAECTALSQQEGIVFKQRARVCGPAVVGSGPFIENVCCITEPPAGAEYILPEDREGPGASPLSRDLELRFPSAPRPDADAMRRVQQQYASERVFNERLRQRQFAEASMVSPARVFSHHPMPDPRLHHHATAFGHHPVPDPRLHPGHPGPHVVHPPPDLRFGQPTRGHGPVFRPMPDPRFVAPHLAGQMPRHF